MKKKAALLKVADNTLYNQSWDDSKKDLKTIGQESLLWGLPSGALGAGLSGKGNRLKGLLAGLLVGGGVGALHGVYQTSPKVKAKKAFTLVLFSSSTLNSSTPNCLTIFSKSLPLKVFLSLILP